MIKNSNLEHYPSLEVQLAKGPRPSFVLILLEKKDDTIYSGIKIRADVAYTGPFTQLRFSISEMLNWEFTNSYGARA